MATNEELMAKLKDRRILPELEDMAPIPNATLPINPLFDYNNFYLKIHIVNDTTSQPKHRSDVLAFAFLHFDRIHFY